MTDGRPPKEAGPRKRNQADGFHTRARTRARLLPSAVFFFKRSSSRSSRRRGQSASGSTTT